MTRRAFAVCTAMLLAANPCLPRTARATQIEVRGAVNAPGVRQLQGHAHLSDAGLAAGLRTDAYTLGAAWLRPSLVVQQQRLRTGLLFDVDSVHRDALKQDHMELAELSASLGQWLRTLPVTGRQVALLDPRVAEVKPAENLSVADGDALYYPHRPTTVRVVGAVQHACELPLMALQGALQYLKSCPGSQLADADWVFVIQPDGHVFRQGVALWNRGNPVSLAPGAVIYVPLSERSVQAIAPDLNRELADFLATQPIAEPERHQ